MIWGPVAVAPLGSGFSKQTLIGKQVVWPAKILLEQKAKRAYGH
jgi:hypothetical protein